MPTKPQFDNQGRNLEGVKKHFDLLERMSLEGSQAAHENYLATITEYPVAEWVMYNNVMVLRCGNSRFVGVPRNGKKTSPNFDVIDIVALEPVTMLKKSEVANWLWRASQNDHLEKTGKISF